MGAIWPVGGAGGKGFNSFCVPAFLTWLRDGLVRDVDDKTEVNNLTISANLLYGEFRKIPHGNL